MAMRYRSLFLILGGAFMLWAGLSSAAVPTRMTFQGKLTNAAGDPVPAGLKSFTFKIYDSPVGGAEIWPAGPGEVQPLSTDDDGLWTAEVGALVPLNEDVFTSDSRWLEVTVNDGVNPAETLTRVKLNTSPYTFQSEQSSNAVNAEHAGDADSLGGLPPSGYSLSGHMHNASSIVDEAGAASTHTFGPVVLAQPSGPMTDLVVDTITAPQAGVIVATGICLVYLSGTAGTNVANIQIDETAGGTALGDYYFLAGSTAMMNAAAAWYFPVHVQRTYSVGPGDHVYRLEGSAGPNAPSAATWILRPTLTLTYFPTAYGTVTP